MKHLELGQPGDVGDVLQLEPVTQVGPVAAEPLHRVVVLEPGQGQRHLLAAELAGHRGNQSLERRQDVLVLDERHLHVKLGELGLAVGSQVLIAEAAGDLEIAVEAGDHQQLLVELGRLGQGVEVPRVHPAGNQEVAGSLGRAAAQDGRLDLEEALLAQDVAHELAEAVADDEDPLHLGPAEVEEAILEAKLFVGLGPVHLEGRRGRGIVEDQLGGPDLDRARLELGVLLAGKPGSDGPLDADDVLIAQVARSGLQLGTGVGLEDHLGDPVAVAQVDEHQAAEVAPGVDPAVEHNGMPDMVFRQVSAGVSPFPAACLIQREDKRSGHLARSHLVIEDHDNPCGRKPSRQRRFGRKSPTRGSRSPGWFAIELADSVARNRLSNCGKKPRERP